MKSKLLWLEVALLAAPFVALAFCWDQIPERVPMHWNVAGEIDGWASKGPGLLLAPLLAVGTVVLLHFLPWLDPKLRRSGGEHGRMRVALPAMRLAVVGLLDLVFFLQLAVSLGQKLDVGRIIVMATLAVLAVVGNFLGNLRPNYFAGIRTPWTLEYPETWRATHRLGGRLLCFGSLILLVVQFIVPPASFVWIFLVATAALVVWSFYYSWRHAHTLEARRKSSPERDAPELRE
ncbi:SdpI family protein [soil metagenome]